MLNQIEFLREKVGFYKLMNHAYKPFFYVDSNGSYENWMEFQKAIPALFKEKIDLIQASLRNLYGFYLAPTSFILSDDMGLLCLSWNYKDQYFSIETFDPYSIEDFSWFHKNLTTSKYEGDDFSLKKTDSKLSESMEYFPRNPTQKSLKELNGLYELVKEIDDNYIIPDQDTMYDILVNGRYVFDPDDIEDGSTSLINMAIANGEIDPVIIKTLINEEYPHISKKEVI